MLSTASNGDILIISFWYPPMLCTQAFRWGPIAKELARRGHRTTVVAGWQPGCPREEWDDGVKVYRVGGGITERLRMSRAAQQPNAQSAQPHERNGTLTWLLRVMKQTHDATWKKVYWPDAHCTWFLAAFRRAKAILEKAEVGMLITVGLPFTSHLVGLALKKKRSQLSWLCDMSDPFSYLVPSPPNNRALYDSLNHAAEALIFKRADTVAVTCEETVRRYAELYPEWAQKLVVIPHLLSTSTKQSLSAASPRLVAQRSVIKLVYAGVLDGRTRDPRAFLDACRRIQEHGLTRDFEVHLYGQIENCDSMLAEYESHFGRWLFLHGLVPREVATDAVEGANILVNIGNKYQCQLPSKLVDYGSTGKPILNVVQCPSDLSMEALKGYQAALHVVCEADRITDFQLIQIEDFLQQESCLTPEETALWSHRFTLSAITSSYEQCFL